MMNLGKNWSSSMARLVGLAMESAEDSTLQLRHGAVLFSSKNQICQTSCNQVGHRVCGYDVPSLHAEANCLKPIYNRASRMRHRYQRKGCSL